jgi:hypothetical protein
MAQKTRAEVEAAIATLLADNTDGSISPEDVRSVFTDIMDSVTWYDEDDEGEGGGGDMTGAEIVTAVELLTPTEHYNFVNGMVADFSTTQRTTFSQNVLPTAEADCLTVLSTLADRLNTTFLIVEDDVSPAITAGFAVKLGASLATGVWSAVPVDPEDLVTEALESKFDGSTDVAIIIGGGGALESEPIVEAPADPSVWWRNNSSGQTENPTDAEAVGILDTVERMTTIATAAPNLESDHHGKLIYLTHATPTLLVQTQAAESYPTVFEAAIVADNDAVIEASTGVSINGVADSSWTLSDAPGAATLKKVSSDTWLLIGSVVVV